MTAHARPATAGLFLLAGLAALLSSPPIAAGDGLPVVGIDARPVSPPGGKLAYVTRRAGRDTALEVIDVDSERRLRRVLLPGRLTVPAIAYDSTPSGITPDGRKLVLITPRRAFPRAETSFAIVDTERLRIRRTLRLKGDFSYDAISPDGRTMYLIHYPSPSDTFSYEVRAYDLRRNRLLPEPIVDPREPDEQMRGLPQTRATSADGRWEYTLYDGGEHPFVHALDTERRRAFCIDLDLKAGSLWGATLELEGGGGTLAVMSGNKLRASIDTRTFRVSSPRPRPAKRPAAPPPPEDGVPWALVVLPTLLLVGAGAAAIARGRLRRHGHFGRAGDPSGRALEGAGGEQGLGRVRDQATRQAAPAAERDRGVQLGAGSGAGELVVDVDRDGAVGGQLETALVGSVDLDVELDGHPGEPARHSRAGAG
jgi:hypothetical protein